MLKPLVGVLIGGASSRMGGSPKGLIQLPSGQTILEHTLQIIAGASLDAVLVGDLDAYDALANQHAVKRIADTGDVHGPLAGLRALLDHAGAQPVIALACDMPFVSTALLQRLAAESPEAAVLAPRSTESGKWEPLCARYATGAVVPVLRQALAEGDQSFQRLFKRLQVAELRLSADERQATRDWDTPQDVTR